MGRGRIPKPKALNDLKGDTHKRRRNTVEPEASTAKPVCPEYLDEIGKAEWQSLTGQLEAMGLLSATDSMAYEQYAAAYSRYRWAEAKCREEDDGLRKCIMEGKDSGFPVLTGYQTAMNQAAEQVRKWLLEFGMTPASRARCAVPITNDNDPRTDKFIRGNR